MIKHPILGSSKAELQLEEHAKSCGEFRKAANILYKYRRLSKAIFNSNLDMSFKVQIIEIIRDRSIGIVKSSNMQVESVLINVIRTDYKKLKIAPKRRNSSVQEEPDIIIKPKKLTRRVDTPENIEYWDFIDETAKEVKSWPSWMFGSDDTKTI